MTEREAVYRGICHSPHDDFPRLIYADLLEESHQPADHDLAEFIRNQIAMESLHEFSDEYLTLKRRTEKLQGKYQADWIEELPKWSRHAETESHLCDFKRGFPDLIYITNDSFLNDAEPLIDACPARNFRIYPISDSAQALAQCPALTHARSLKLIYQHEPMDVRHILNSQYLPLLAELSIQFHSSRPYSERWSPDRPITDIHAQQLAACPKLSRLKKLNISDGYLTMEGIRALTKSPYFKELERLELYGHELEDDAIQLLASSALGGNLTHLNIGKNLIADKGIQALFSGILPKLKSLNVSNSGNAVTDDAFHSLTYCETLSELQELDLMGWKLTARQAHTLAQCPYLTNLKKLNLNGSGINDEILSEFSRSPFLKSLRFLDLRNSEITSQGIMNLAESPVSQPIVRLYLFNYKNPLLVDQGIEAIANSGMMTSLRELRICSTGLGMTALKAICRSTTLARLRSLDIMCNQSLGDAGAEELLNSDYLRHIDRLDVQICGFSKRMKQKLRERFGEALIVDDK